MFTVVTKEDSKWGSYYPHTAAEEMDAEKAQSSEVIQLVRGEAELGLRSVWIQSCFLGLAAPFCHKRLP